MWKKILASLLLLAVVVVGGGLAYLYFKPVNMRAASDLTVERTPERIARGSYLFNHVSSCAYCHSPSDEKRFAYPMIPGGMGQGRVVPDPTLPGTIVASNITPDTETGAGRWTDGQLLRAIREGIGHDGRVLFPVMPYTFFRNLSDEDAYSIIAYMRTLPQGSSSLPATTVKFPVNLFIKFIPSPVGKVPPADRADPVAWGRYLVDIAGCKFCHSPVEMDGSPVKGKEFSGGHSFQLTAGARAVTPNLTPDRDTGTGTWSEAEWIEKFTQYKDYAANGSPVVEPNMNTAMPWLNFSNLETGDLHAIFAYLRTVPPVKNAVVTHPDSPEEQRARQGGAR